MLEAEKKIGRKYLDRLFHFVEGSKEEELKQAKSNLHKRIDNAVKFDESTEDWFALMSLVRQLERVKERFK